MIQTTHGTATELPSYDRPPVMEVVCGIQFKPLRLFLVPHFGELWARFKSEYPQCEEAPPLAPAVERFDGLPPTDIQPPSEPLLPRIWFVHKDGNGIIQVQRDRFLHNWRKARPEDDYPRYGKVVELFRGHCATFAGFLADNGLGTIEPVQYEMTYVNQILQGEGWEALEDIGKVFPDFDWLSNAPWSPDAGRFLPTPEGRNLRLNFTLPDRSARLHVTIRNGIRREDRAPVLLLELTVRGIGADKSLDAMWDWFAAAHEWIVRGFADLTGKEIQEKVWRRTR